MLNTTQKLQNAILNSINVIKQSRIMLEKKELCGAMTEKEMFVAHNKLAKAVKTASGLEANVERTQYRGDKEAGYSSIHSLEWNYTSFVSATEISELETALKAALPTATTVKVSVEGLDTDCASYNTSLFRFNSHKRGDVYRDENGQFINSCNFTFFGSAKLQNGGELRIFIIDSPMYIVDALIADAMIA